MFDTPERKVKLSLHELQLATHLVAMSYNKMHMPFKYNCCNVRKRLSLVYKISLTHENLRFSLVA